MGNETVALRQVNATTMVVTPGRLLDNQMAPEMVEAFANGLRQGCRFIVVDLSQVEFLSSAGAGSIIGFVEQYRQAGGDVILCNPSDTILHVLSLLDLNDYLTIKKDLAEATALCAP